MSFLQRGGNDLGVSPRLWDFAPQCLNAGFRDAILGTLFVSLDPPLLQQLSHCTGADRWRNRLSS